MHGWMDHEPESIHDAYRRLVEHADATKASGDYLTAVYPHFTIGSGLVILYLLLDHRKSAFLQHLRIPVWLINVAFSIHVCIYYRGRSPAAALGVGLLSSWYILWTGAVLVFDDCQVDYARIEKHRGTSTSNSLKGSAKHKHATSSDTQTYFWQRYPDNFGLSRLDWVLDVMTTFRGQSWSWRISGLPAVPAQVEADLKSTASTLRLIKAPSKSSFASYTTRSAVLRSSFYYFARDWFILDMVTVVRAHDPYFWGDPDTTRLPGYLPESLCYPFVVNLCRILICYAALRYALDAIFRLGPFFYVGVLGKHASVRGEAWDNPDQFGSTDAVFDKGLAGFWGSFWHQTFRHGFQAPAKWLVRSCGLQPKSLTAQFLQLFTAFTLSGFLHAMGSHTQIGKTRPIAGPLIFFWLQAVGIVVQVAFTEVMKHSSMLNRIPRRIRRWSNLIFALTWLYNTAWLELNDFNTGGVWLFEPLPVSILRGPLGLGDAEDGWFCWGGGLLGWHTGEHWWNSGIAA